MLSNLLSNPLVIVGVVLVGVFLVVPMIVAAFLRDVDAGTIRIVSWLAGNTVIYRGPGKSKEIPLLTTGTTISSKIINVDLDITDQTADLDDNERPQPIKVRVLASAIEDEARAVTNFDKNGQGLISVEVDGRVIQCLGTLITTDRDAGIRVRAGDTVRIEDVDADRNRCTVRKA